MMFCSACGTAVSPGSKFCFACGSAVSLAGATAVPVVLVTGPPPKTIKQRANDTTELIGRVGCNLLVGFLVFKVAVVIAIIIGCWLLFWPVMHMMFGR
jgi:hypothetical protein